MTSSQTRSFTQRGIHISYVSSSQRSFRHAGSIRESTSSSPHRSIPAVMGNITCCPTAPRPRRATTSHGHGHSGQSYPMNPIQPASVYHGHSSRRAQPNLNKPLPSLPDPTFNVIPPTVSRPVNARLPTRLLTHPNIQPQPQFAGFGGTGLSSRLPRDRRGFAPGMENMPRMDG